MWHSYDQLMSLFEDIARAFMEGEYTLDEAIELFRKEREEIFL